MNNLKNFDEYKTFQGTSQERSIFLEKYLEYRKVDKEYCQNWTPHIRIHSAYFDDLFKDMQKKKTAYEKVCKAMNVFPVWYFLKDSNILPENPFLTELVIKLVQIKE